MTSADAIERVHENDGNEMNGHETASSCTPTCPEHISSILRKYAIYPQVPIGNNRGIRFEIKEGPKLEEWIPESYLPEVLVVYDPDGVSSFGSKSPPMKIYRRTHPAPTLSRKSEEGNAVRDG